MSYTGGAMGFEEIGRKARRIQDAVERVRGIGATGLREVGVEVSVDGRIQSLQLSQYVTGFDPERIAALIIEAQHKAVSDAERAAGALRKELTDDPRVARAFDLIGSATTVTDIGPPRGRVVETVAEDVVDLDNYNGSGMSVLEDPLGRDGESRSCKRR